MKTDFYLYYLLKLIQKGQEWQNKDLNGSKLSNHRFSWLQIGALILAALFVYLKPQGLYDNTNLVDFMLSSLSITTALLFSIIVVVLDRARSNTFNSQDEDGRKNDIHQWNHLYQFASVVGNAILWSLLVIIILISTMLYGHKVDLGEFTWCGWANMWQPQSLYLFVKYVFVSGVRFVLVYALFNFFILFLFALLSLFESICSELDIKRPHFDIPENRRNNVSAEFLLEYGKLNKIIIIVSALVLFCIAIVYVV